MNSELMSNLCERIEEENIENDTIRKTIIQQKSDKILS
jgi:hypothetical protein